MEAEQPKNQSQEKQENLIVIVVMIIFFGVVPLMHLHILFPRGCSSTVSGDMLAFIRNFQSAQILFSEAQFVDKDKDGVGEFGYISELLATPPSRSPQILTEFPCMSFRPHKQVSPMHIQLQRYKYEVILFLPTSVLGESFIDMDEKYWFGFAWPQKNRDDAESWFFDSESNISFTKNTKYNGEEMRKKLLCILEDKKNWNMENVLKLLPQDLKMFSQK